MTTSTEEIYEQRLARIRAQEQAEREHRTSLPPIDPASLIVTLGPVEGHDPDNPICSRCGGCCGTCCNQGTVVGIAIDGQPGKVCSDCLEGDGDDSYSAALARLVRALEDVAAALSIAADTGHQADLFNVASKALRWLGEAYGVAPSPEQLHALSAAMQEHGVATVGELPADVLDAILNSPTTLAQSAARSGCSRCSTAPGYCDSLAPAACCPGCNHEPHA